MPDWRVSKTANLLWTTNGNENREKDDFYATDPNSLRRFLDKIKEDNLELSHNIWECACGSGALSGVLKEYGYDVMNSDIVNRGYEDTIVWDFLKPTNRILFRGDILTNPPYKCFDSEALCYTKRGWLSYNEITLEDEVLSVNPYTKEIEWSKINKIIIRDFNPIIDKMYHFKHNHLDIMCTNDHRMFAYNIKTNKLMTKNNDLIKSQDIRTTMYMPRTGYSWKGTSPKFFILNDSIKIKMEDWLSFFGLWLADGYCRHTKNKNGNYRKTVGIKQLEENKEWVTKILDKLPFTYHIYRDIKRKKSCVNIEIHNEDLWEYLRAFGKSDTKFIPEDLKDLNLELLKVLLDAYFLGDGVSYKGTGRIYSTVSFKLACDIQEILFKLGRLTHISKREYKRNKFIYSIVYSKSSLYDHTNYPSNKKEQCLINYTGKVWCINLEKNGVFLLKRNDKEFLCGNCALEFIKTALEEVYDGSKVIMYLKLQFLEGKERREFYKENPPKYIYVFSDRQTCYPNGDFSEKKGSTVCYCWYIWEKGFKGEPVIRWL